PPTSAAPAPCLPAAVPRSHQEAALEYQAVGVVWGSLALPGYRGLRTGKTRSVAFVWAFPMTEAIPSAPRDLPVDPPVPALLRLRPPPRPPPRLLPPQPPRPLQPPRRPQPRRRPQPPRRLLQGPRLLRQRRRLRQRRLRHACPCCRRLCNRLVQPHR